MMIIISALKVPFDKVTCNKRRRNTIKTTTRGYNIVADGWARAFLSTATENDNCGVALFNSNVTDG